MIEWIYKTSDRSFGAGRGTTYRIPPKGFLWIRCVRPTDAEKKKLKKDFRIKHFDRYAKERRSYRYSYKPLCFTIVDYYVANGRISKTNVLFSVHKNVIVTITDKQVPTHQDTFKDIKENLKDYVPSTARVLYDILEDDAEENYEVLEATERNIVTLEKDIIDPNKAKKSLERVITLKRELSNMTRIFWTSSKILYSVRKGLTPLELDDRTSRLFDAVHDTFIHEVDLASTQKEMLTDALTIYETTLSNKLALISNKINVSVQRLTWIMLLLTGLALVLTVPNTLATVFGIPSLGIGPGFAGTMLALIALSLVIPFVWFLLYWKKLTRADKAPKRPG